jgi:hypothetical protein
MYLKAALLDCCLFSHENKLLYSVGTGWHIILFLGWLVEEYHIVRYLSFRTNNRDYKALMIPSLHKEVVMHFMP